VDYPFAALVGQEQLKLALLLNAVHPGIGGVLVRGEKGTAKSTAARGLADLLPNLTVVAGCPFHCDPADPWLACPHCGALGERPASEMPVPFVDLPLGATEDRVLGSLDFERALREGRRHFQPGLLAAAHRGILYVDEVNLLADHLVDVLLDAAALGINTVQREGVSVSHPARFLLVGTMNPEEGDLRPQLLDRFGLMVTVAGPRDPDLRAEVVRRRLAFEDDPAAFARQWEAEQVALRQSILAARGRLSGVRLGDGLLTLLTRLCAEFEVDGLRADIVLHKTARALAALHGSPAVTLENIRTAAELVLPHRQRRRPFQPPELDRQRLEDALSRLQPPDSHPSSSGAAPPGADSATQPPPPTSSPPTGDSSSAPTASDSGERVFQPAPAPALRPFEVQAAGGSPRPATGRRNPAPGRGQGQYVRAVPDPAPSDLALDATLRAAAGRGGLVEGRLAIERGDLHGKEREGRTGTLVLFVVDASGSMAARRRMEAVKGAVLGLLQDAYEQRDRVGVIAFRGPRAEVLLLPTAGAEAAEQALRVLPTGGRTPLAHALLLARETLHRARRAGPAGPALLVLLTDGKANVCLPDEPGDPWQQALKAASALAGDEAAALVLDTETGFIRSGKAGELAAALGCACLSLEDLSADSLLLQVRRCWAGKGGKDV
jgi:magnesium chelatase subunit D